MKLHNTFIFTIIAITAYALILTNYIVSADKKPLSVSSDIFLRFDINRDSIISKDDLNCLKSELVSSKNCDNILDNDLNNDGKENIVDLTVIKKHISSASKTIYLSSDGDDGNSGEITAPLATLNHALEIAETDGIIYIMNKFALPADFKWEEHSKTVTITGDVLDCTATPRLKIRDGVTFKNINIIFKEGGLLYACGKSFRIEKSVNITGEIAFFGGDTELVKSTNATLLSGNYYYIYGGGNYADVSGDIFLSVGGKVNNLPQTGYSKDNTYSIFGGCIEGNVGGNIHLNIEGNINQNLNYKSHEPLACVYGGCNSGNVYGNIELNIGHDTKFNYIVGGGKGNYADVGENITVNFSGNAMSIVGGNCDNILNGNTQINILDGWVEQIFGGCENASMVGNSTVNLSGGTIVRRVFGGCYNNLEKNLLPFAKKSDYHVSGTSTVIISDEVNIEYSKNANAFEDVGISAASRHKNSFEDEEAIVIFLNKDAKEKYSKKLGVSINNKLLSNFIKFSSPYDTISVAE